MKSRFLQNKIKNTEKICIHCQHNMTIPSDDISYSRQLQECSFCVHVVSTQRSYFMYGECDAQKGPNECNGFLHHFINNKLDEYVTELNILLNNSSFKNKNHSLVQYFYTHLNNECWPPLWSSGQSFWLQIQRSGVRFPTLPYFLRGSGSGTGSTQPREYSWV
jgi:hypothetical protein